MITFILTDQNLPFAVALALMMLIAVLEGVTTVLGMGLSGILDSLMPEMDVDIDIGMDADVDADVDATHFHPTGPLTKVLNVLVIAGVILVAMIVIGMILATLYRRATKEISFVRTGFGGQKVILNGGALVLPVLHDTIPVNMNTLRLEVQRANTQALITRDRMRVACDGGILCSGQAHPECHRQRGANPWSENHESGRAESLGGRQICRRLARRGSRDGYGRIT